MSYWDRLKPQVEELISDLHFQGYTDSCIANVLHQPNWIEHPIFKNEKFNYRRADVTLQQFCDIIDLFIGSDELLQPYIALRIGELLNVGYEQDIVAREGQQQLVEELKRAIEKGDAA